MGFLAVVAVGVLGVAGLLALLPTYAERRYLAEQRWRRTPDEQERDLRGLQVSRRLNHLMAGMMALASVVVLVRVTVELVG